MILGLHEIVLQIFQMDNEGNLRFKSSCRCFYKFWCEVSKQKDFIRELVWLLNESPQFTSARLKTYLFYFFKLLHKKNSSYGITEGYLKNALTYDREAKKLLHKNYMVALVIERQDEKPGEIKDVIQREKPISYELGLDKYLSDVIFGMQIM